MGPHARGRDCPDGPRPARVPHSRGEHQYRLCREPAEAPDVPEQRVHHQVHRHDAGIVQVLQAARPGYQGADLYRRYHGERASRDDRPRETGGCEASAPARVAGRARPRHPHAAGRQGRQGRRRLDAGAGAAAADRHHHARRASVAAGHAHAVHRHGARGPGLCRQPARSLQCRMLGRGDLRRGLPVPAGMPVAAPARSARQDAEPADAMLLRASNGVGYTNYPDNVVQEFVRQAAETGVDVFRVFDSLNWVENMRVAMDAVIDSGKICEGTICYTGDVLDPDRAKYDLKYYVSMARELEAAGAHVLGVKDMAGLLKPAAARQLIRALKDEVGLPVHFHTHDTAGIASATILAAAESGVDAVDCAMDSFSGNTSQATLGTVVEALRHTERDTGLDIKAIRAISDYWEAVRAHYAAFEIS